MSRHMAIRLMELGIVRPDGQQAMPVRLPFDGTLSPIERRMIEQGQAEEKPQFFYMKAGGKKR